MKILVCKAETRTIDKIASWIEKMFRGAEIIEFKDTEELRKWLLESEQNPRQMLMINRRREAVTVRISEIVFIESKKRMLEIHTRTEKITCYMKLGDMENMLPDHFIRCHQSYIVNMHSINSFRGKTIELVNEERVPVSRNRYMETIRKFEAYCRK